MTRLESQISVKRVSHQIRLDLLPALVALAATKVYLI